MDKPEPSATTEPTAQSHPESELPPGNHPLEVAARRGIGPLSPLGREAWHGRSRPCVSCGQLVQRDAKECDYCGQDLSHEMIEKMRAHAGPWYVLEHVRPFPGVSLERIIRQIRRGLITETSILRGPSTDFQWRFAVETPGICRYFGRCWSCHEKVSPSDTYCQHCLSYLSFEKPHPVGDAPPSASGAGSAERSTTPAVPTSDPSPERERRVGQAAGRALPAESRAGGMGKRQLARANVMQEAGKRSLPSPPGQPNEVAPTPADELKRLSAAVDKAELPDHEVVWDEPPRIAGIRATWIAAALLIVVIVALMFLTRSRSQSTTPPQPAAPGMILPQ